MTLTDGRGTERGTVKGDVCVIYGCIAAMQMSLARPPARRRRPLPSSVFRRSFKSRKEAAARELYISRLLFLFLLVLL